MDEEAKPPAMEELSQIDKNFKLRRSEKWIPIVFGCIGTATFVGLIVGGVFGSDYYLPRGQKKQKATFFEEEIDDDTTYGLLIFMSTLLGFMRAVFDDVAGPQWSRLVNLHNSRGDAVKLAEAYKNESLMWATILGARLWAKTSDALMIYFSFTDLYIFLGGFVGNILGGILVFFRYFDPLLDPVQQKDFWLGKFLPEDPFVGAAAPDPSFAPPRKLIF